MSLISGIGHTEATPDQVFDSGDIDLKEDEILEQERSEEGELDDSPEPLRPVQMIVMPKGGDGKANRKGCHQKKTVGRHSITNQQVKYL